jgi:amino acid transporter
MMYLVFALIFIAYLYFGYKDDYKRDNISFKMTVFGILGMLLIGSFIFYIGLKFEKPIRKAVSVHYDNTLGIRKEMKKSTSKEDISNIDFDKLFKEDSMHNSKVDSVMRIYDSVIFVLFYLIVNQFNKLSNE